MKSSKESRFFRVGILKWLPVLVGCLLYLNTGEHEFVLDDNLVISRNVYVQKGISAAPTLLTTNYAHGHNGQSFNDGLYRPLSLISFALEKSIYGLNPGVSHIIQAMLYALLLLALLFWLQSFFGAKDWVWWTVLLFAVHPVHVEVVANLKSRDELFALLFFALSAWQFSRWLATKRMLYLGLSTLLFLFALFSKESAVTFSAIYPLMLWYSNTKADRNTWLKTAVLVTPLALFLSIRTWVLQRMGPVDSGVTGMLQNVLSTSDSLIERIATAGRIQLLYFEQLVTPFTLSSDYSYNAIPLSDLTSIPALLGLILTLAAIAFGTVAVKRKRPEGFGIAFYFITISVVANVLILIGAMAAERFLFAPSLGFCLSVSYGIYHWKAIEKVRLVVIGTYAVFFIGLSAMRIPDWKDEYTLFTQDVMHTPESARAHYNAGSASNTKAKSNPQESVALREQAIKHLNEAIAIWPAYQDAYNNLGIVYLDARQYNRAVEVFTDLINRFPEYSKAYYNLGFTAYQTEAYDKAEAAFESYFERNPSNDVLYLIAECEGYQQKFDEAISHLNTLIQNEPNKGRGYLKLGMAYAITGNLEAAEQIMLKGTQVAPREVELYFNLGLLYFNNQRTEQAMNALQQALNIQPDHGRSKQLLTDLQARRAQNVVH